jgi:hypothetical protein
MRWWLRTVVILGMLIFTPGGRAEQKLKAGFIYVGPIGDYGWTHAHEQARKIVLQQFPWLETLAVEAVPEGQAETFIDQMVRQGAKVHAGTYTPKNLQDVDYWWLLAEGAVELGGTPGVPINPVFEAPLKAVKVQDAIAGELAVYDLVIKRLKQMSQRPPAFDPFEGPITDRKGTLRVPAGKRMTQQELITMEWAAQGVVGPWANEP